MMNQSHPTLQMVGLSEMEERPHSGYWMQSIAQQQSIKQRCSLRTKSSLRFAGFPPPIFVIMLLFGYTTCFESKRISRERAKRMRLFKTSRCRGTDDFESWYLSTWLVFGFQSIFIVFRASFHTTLLLPHNSHCFPLVGWSLLPFPLPSIQLVKMYGMNDNQNIFMDGKKTTSRVTNVPGGKSTVNLGWDSPKGNYELLHCCCFLGHRL